MGGMGGMSMPMSGTYADRANKVPMDGGASSSAAFGAFFRRLITMAAGGIAGAGAGGVADDAGATATGGIGGGIGGATGAAPLASAAGPSAAAWCDAVGAMGSGAGPMAGLGGAGYAAQAATAAAPSMGQSALHGFSKGGIKGGLQEMLANYGQAQPAGSALNDFATGLSRSGNMMGGLQAQFMDPMGAPVVGNMNMFDLTNMGLQRLTAGDQQRRRNWWEK